MEKTKCDDFCKKKVEEKCKKNDADKKKNPMPTKSKIEAIFKKTLQQCKTPEEREEVKKKYKQQLEFIKNAQKLFKTMYNKKRMLKECNDQYCNPTCKGTMYEDEPGTGYLNTLNKLYKDPKTVDIYVKSRKKYFNGKKSVLQDNFNEKITPTKRNRLKKEGALSGCIHEKNNCSIM